MDKKKHYANTQKKTITIEQKKKNFSGLARFREKEEKKYVFTNNIFESLSFILLIFILKLGNCLI